ncbi:MAG: DUF1800 domain-containing protein [Gammaproteobacteria bacterium]|nr:DUF1800 domain-containing protein [Gammaproteobacteria bacterium]
MARIKPASIALSLLLTLAGCGGSSGNGSSPPPPPPPPSPPPVTTAEAFQFLNQASFGATAEEAQAVIASGIEAWIDQQLQVEASLQLPHLRAVPPPQFPFQLQPDRVDVWFRNAVNGDDQLRQRVAFALSEIMVVSQIGALSRLPFSLADYYDMLATNAFGNYRDLMQAVTLHPAMGVYLSMLGNEKPDPLLNIRPDENYARELMQLFSIGLVELNQDGTLVRDAQNQPIPTYNQQIIEGFAHVYTGWNFSGAPSFEFAQPNAFNQTAPMQLYPSFHDTGEKSLLSGVTLPAGQTGDQDLAAALDTIFNHPNVAPFISIRLIQRLVTSNPSPSYVGRVAATFNDNGQGVRGDLAAVVKAILMDEEARPALPMDPDGKIKEPLLRLTQLWRAYNATSVSGRYQLLSQIPPVIFLGQGPLQTPSVFNFFSPFYAPPGEFRDNDFVAPELEIATEYQNTLITNYMFYQTFFANSVNAASPELTDDDVLLDISEEMALADDTDALINAVVDKLMAGQISQVLRDEISGMLALIADPDDDALRVAETIYLVVTSPEYAFQR